MGLVLPCQHVAQQLIVRVRQNALLAEIIKVNAPNPQVLLNVINVYNMSPRLEEVPLPQGPSFAFLTVTIIFLAFGKGEYRAGV